MISRDRFVHFLELTFRISALIVLLDIVIFMMWVVHDLQITSVTSLAFQTAFGCSFWLFLVPVIRATVFNLSLPRVHYPLCFIGLTVGTFTLFQLAYVEEGFVYESTPYIFAAPLMIAACFTIKRFFTKKLLDEVNE